MSFTEADGKRAVRWAVDYLEDNRMVGMNVPIGIILDIGTTVALQASKKGHHGESNNLELEIMGRLEEVLPPELLVAGRDSYQGDLRERVHLSLSRIDIEMITLAAFALPDGTKIVTSLSFIDPKDRQEFDEFKQKKLTSARELHEIFISHGGKEIFV